MPTLHGGRDRGTEGNITWEVRAETEREMVDRRDVDRFLERLPLGRGTRRVYRSVLTRFVEWVNGDGDDDDQRDV